MQCRAIEYGAVYEGEGRGGRSAGHDGSPYCDRDRKRRGGVFIGQGARGTRIFLMEFLDQLVGVDVGQGLPAVMCFREAFPPDQVLELAAVASCAQNSGDFPFGLPIN